MLASLLLERFRVGRVLAAAERWERADAGVSAELQAPPEAWREMAASTAALLAAVRARREVSDG